MRIEKTIAELQRFFDFFNGKLFEGKLERPVILIQTNGKHNGVLGWCTSKKVWRESETSKNYYEITLCAEHLTRAIESIVGTMIHEMVHLHNLQFDIKDVSRGGTYHNKKFKSVAETKGLIIEYDKRIGWSLTKLQDDTLKLISELKPALNLFKVSRSSQYEIPSTEGEEGESEGEEAAPKSSTRKYVCPHCNTIIRATKDVSVICGICNVPFVLEEK